MESQTLNSNLNRTEEEAFAPGAELWVVPSLSESSWTQKIDWYLNFQILRSKNRKAPQPPPPLEEVIRDWELEPPKIDVSERAPLMIVSSELLPNHAVVLVPSKADVSSWAGDVYSTWSKLDKPSLRIFLPKSLAARDFAKAWPEAERDSLSHALVEQVAD